jgi:hypothetical protein
MKIAYLVHNLNDPAVERRCVMLERGGAEVKLAGFCRDQTLAGAIAARSPLQLGLSKDAALVQRATGTLRAAFLDGRVKRFFADCDIVMARNLEQLGIARAIIGDRALVYECLDIHRSLVGSSGAAKLIQLVESKLLPRVNLLITSSPAFVENHFASTSLASPIQLVENKLLVDDIDTFQSDPQPSFGSHLTIGWFGMLRCEQTLSVLTELANRAAGKIKILIAGKPSPAVFPDFAGAIAEIPDVEYVGSYHYSDLPKLYGRCHFAWAIDWFEEGENSSWLLPNRIYEAVAHGSVPIALANIEVGRWLANRGAGLLVDDAAELQDILSNMSASRLHEYQAAIEAIPRGDVLVDDQGCRALVKRLSDISMP